MVAIALHLYCTNVSPRLLEVKVAPAHLGTALLPLAPLEPRLLLRAAVEHDERRRCPRGQPILGDLVKNGLERLQERIWGRSSNADDA